MSSGSINIRALAENELPLLHDLWVSAGMDYRPLGRDSIDNLSEQWRVNRTGFIGAFDVQRLIGSVLATDDGRRGWINRLAVHPEYRRTGLGGALIKAAEDELHQRGLQIIAALIENDNNASLKLFSSQKYDAMPEVVYFSKRDSWDV